MAMHSLRRDVSSFRFVVAITIIMSMLFCVRHAGAADANAAQAFVQQNIERANAIFGNRSTSPEQRQTEFGRLLLSITDTHRIGLFVLGQYGNDATPEQLSAFQNTFTDYVIGAFESQLDKFKGGRMAVTGATMRMPDEFVVNTELTRSIGSEPLTMAFRLRALPDGSFVVTDMQFEGLWLALSEREEFTAFLQKHGGDISALTDNLRDKMQTLAGTGRGSRSAG
jgi:phospholipid transport system substrate-binding protein